MLKIVLGNLMRNVAKFTHHNALARVRVGLRDDGRSGVRISVQDNGVGFDPARADQLFRPISRLYARDDYAGSGIGLSIVQRIVERHGGTVQTTSDGAGMGVCFEFTLAQAPVSQHAVAIVGAAPSLSEQPDSVVAVPG